MTASTASSADYRKPVLNTPGFDIRESEREPSTAASPSRLRIFSGTSNEGLSREVAQYLGISLGDIKIKKFADGEIYVQLQESVRGCDVFLVQVRKVPVKRKERGKKKATKRKLEECE